MFHDRLKALRLKAGLSQKQVADFLKVTPQSVSKWEKGEALPSIDYLPGLAQCLNCDINAFFAKDEGKPIDYHVAVALFEVQAGVLEETKQFEEMAALMSENMDLVETATEVCNKLLTYKTVNLRCIRGILGCGEAEARTFLGYLERCEMVEKLDVDDIYYVNRDATEGFMILLKIQKHLYDVKTELEQKQAES